MKHRTVISMSLLAVAATSPLVACHNRVQTDSAPAAIADFNKKFIDAHRKMDNAAVLSRWSDDGVSLLPGMAPLRGKQAIGKFFDDAVAQLGGYPMATMELDFRQIQTMHDWAYEWGIEHQVLQSSEGKPTIEGRGNIPLMLHRNEGGAWKIQQEMWNAAPKPPSETKSQ
jgi:uncharacterized protein (TIGR02246 family)